MTELEKLKHLLEHWIEHNDAHVKTYEEWAAKAANLGEADLSIIIKEIAANSKKLDELFRKALGML